MIKFYSQCIPSPVGALKLKATEENLIAIQFIDEYEKAGENTSTNLLLQESLKQLDEYFSGKRTAFNLPIKPEGTSFQKSVWKELRQVGFGSTISYKQLAQYIGQEDKARAVGHANAKNPLPIILPCHRIIGADNNLSGYAGGIRNKIWLLQHEGALLL